MTTRTDHDLDEEVALQIDTKEVLADYRLAFRSRQVSLIGRREVLSGKANFGIFGDGKEIAQLAMAKVFQNGDFAPVITGTKPWPLLWT
ncbi:MAG: hypothetical protein IPL78_05685 [Chloroflexi bacterium]|nr:hypothetical protein [Chloroflexota bacterium]